MTVKIVLIGDVHLSDRAPSSCYDNYTDDLFDLLYQATALAKTINADAIVQLGDLFHIKTPGKNSHNLVQRTLEWALDSEVPIGVVAGNHDMMYDRYDSLNDTQPLGVLAKAKAIDLINGWSSGKLSHLPIYGIPWLQHWTAEALKQSLVDWNWEPLPGLLVTHAPLFPLGKEPMYEHYSTSKFADAMSNVGYVAYGHIHDWHGVYDVNGVRFMNHGALSRGSLTESNQTRPVGVTIWDSSTDDFEFVPLKYKPSEDVFRLTEVLQERQRVVDAKSFFESISSSELSKVSVEEIIKHMKALPGIESTVIQLAEELLQEARQV